MEMREKDEYLYDMLLETYIREALEEKRLKMQFQDKNGIESDIQDFLAFCIEKLEIQESPRIAIVNEIPSGTHGAYWPDRKTIKVVGRGRCLSDILRSLAHELVHHQQNEQNRIEIINDDGVGGHIEDEANSVAGQLVKAYGINNRKIYQTY
jgi:hypothetical protein